MTRTILVAEDIAMNMTLAVKRLTHKGYRVLEAVDGEKAVELANTEKPDIILMDMKMPVMDGYEATRQLKKKERTKNIPIIGLSANAQKIEEDKAMDCGCDLYLTKPVNFRLLFRTLEEYLGPLPTEDAPKSISSAS